MAEATAVPRAVLRGVAARISEHGLTDRAAALTYYGFLSLFPALIVAVALLGLLGNYPETYESIRLDPARRRPRRPPSTRSTAPSDDALRSRGTAGSLLGVGLAALPSTRPRAAPARRCAPSAPSTAPRERSAVLARATSTASTLTLDGRPDDAGRLHRDPRRRPDLLLDRRRGRAR